MRFTRSLLAVFWLLLCSSSCVKDQPVGPTVAGGSPILFTSGRDANLDIFVMESDGSAPRYLTRDAAVDQSADWFPDGFAFKIAFMSNRDGDYEVFVMFVNGRGVQQVTNNAAREGFSPVVA